MHNEISMHVYCATRSECSPKLAVNTMVRINKQGGLIRSIYRQHCLALSRFISVRNRGNQKNDVSLLTNTTLQFQSTTQHAARERDRSLPKPAQDTEKGINICSYCYLNDFNGCNYFI